MSKFEYLKKYELTFYDHFMGDKKEIICKTVGYFLNRDKQYLHFSYWIVETNDNEMFNNNLEKFSIMKNSIIKIKSL